MPEELPTPPAGTAAPPPMPDPEKLKPSGLSDKHKRYIYFGIAGVLVFLILANIVGSNGSTAPKAERQVPAGQRENPSPAQIRDWENSLKQAEAQLQQETRDRQRQLDAVRGLQPQNAPAQTPTTFDDLQRAAALNDAAIARQQWQQNASAQGSVQPQKSQIETEQAQQAYKSLFADNLVRQESPAAFNSQPRSEASQTTSAPPATFTDSAAQSKPEADKNRKPLDFDPTAEATVWLPEGTVIEAVLTNRLDGDAVGPVDCMITNDVYQPGTRVLLIPQGARVLGEASKVSSLGQARLAVSFHRILVPGLRTYSIPLDKPTPALGPAGDVGLHDKVNNHYLSIFGASLAVGAIGGLAQIGNGTSGFGYDPSVELRNGITQSTAQSSDRILDRFLNRMPAITIREGARVKIILTDDLRVPTYDTMAAPLPNLTPNHIGDF
jgi:type IV secretion system protein VirB10